VRSDSVFLHTWHHSRRARTRVRHRLAALIALKSDVARDLERLRAPARSAPSRAEVTVLRCRRRPRALGLGDELRFVLITSQRRSSRPARRGSGFASSEEGVWIKSNPAHSAVRSLLASARRCGQQSATGALRPLRGERGRSGRKAAVRMNAQSMASPDRAASAPRRGCCRPHRDRGSAVEGIHHTHWVSSNSDRAAHSRHYAHAQCRCGVQLSGVRLRLQRWLFIGWR